MRACVCLWAGGCDCVWLCVVVAVAVAVSMAELTGCAGCNSDKLYNIYKAAGHHRLN